MAYSVVIYDMGTLAVNDGRTLSLFIQTFFIALFVGSILFFFMYKLIEYPYTEINRQLDAALKEENQQIELNFQFPAVQTLIANISSALSRMGSSNPMDNLENQFVADRSQEMGNIIQLMGFPALAIQANDQSIAALNSNFEEKTGLASSDLLYGNLGGITDQSLKLSLEDLFERVMATPEQMAANELEFNGIKHEIMAQAVLGNNEVSYIVIVILPMDEEAVA